MRCPKKLSRQAPACACLIDAFRTFPAKPDYGQGCNSPDCLVRNIDSITLHQFVAAIGGPNDDGDGSGGSEDRS